MAVSPRRPPSISARDWTGFREMRRSLTLLPGEAMETMGFPSATSA